MATPRIRPPSRSSEAEAALAEDCRHRRGAIFEQRARAGSPRRKAAGQREPRLPVLGLLHRFILGLFAAT